MICRLLLHIFQNYFPKMNVSFLLFQFLQDIVQNVSINLKEKKLLLEPF